MITFETLRDSGIIPNGIRFVNIDRMNPDGTHQGLLRQLKFRLEADERDDLALFQTGLFKQNDGNLCMFFNGNYVSFKETTPVSKLQEEPFRRFAGKIFTDDDITECDICTESGSGFVEFGGEMVQRSMTTCRTCFKQMCITCRLRYQNKCAYCRTVNEPFTAVSTSMKQWDAAKKYLEGIRGGTLS